MLLLFMAADWKGSFSF